MLTYSLESTPSPSGKDRYKPLVLKAFKNLAPRFHVATASTALFAYATLLYFTVFKLTRDMTIGNALVTAFENIVPLTLVGAAVFALTTLWTRYRSAFVQTIVHAVGAPAFSILWYLGIQIVRGINPSVLTEGLDPQAFAVFVIGWQVVQGSFAYAAIVMGAYWTAEHSKVEQPPAQAQPSRADRLFVRDKGVVYAVSHDDIISISRREDYSEIQTRTAVHLSSRSLADLESALPSDIFLRVHRSAIVNLNAVLGAEPTGTGRLTLALPGGRAVQTSRAGRTAFLERAA